MTVLEKVYLYADDGLQQRAKEAAKLLGMKMPDFYRMAIEFGINAAKLVEHERKEEQASGENHILEIRE